MAIVVLSRRHHHIAFRRLEISMYPPSLLSRPLRPLNTVATCQAQVASPHHVKGHPKLRSCPTSCCPKSASTISPTRKDGRKREEQEARSLAKQARQRRDFSAEARHKQDARVRKLAMERLNKEAATTAIFNKKNKVLWPITTRFQSHAY